jgi:signal transduction histidine kinase
MYLDPVYGRFNHVSPEAREEGSDEEYSCPKCRGPLLAEEVRCDRCGAAAFGIRTSAGDAVWWCSRRGCHWSKWPACDAAGLRSMVELTVADEGGGIPEEALAHLFEPFFSTKGTRGTGLGLAVTWGIVEGHGGTIDVWSEPGKGSRFTVRLPLEPVNVSGIPADRHAERISALGEEIRS